MVGSVSKSAGYRSAIAVCAAGILVSIALQAGQASEPTGTNSAAVQSFNVAARGIHGEQVNSTGSRFVAHEKNVKAASHFAEEPPKFITDNENLLPISSLQVSSEPRLNAPLNASLDPPPIAALNETLHEPLNAPPSNKARNATAVPLASRESLHEFLVTVCTAPITTASRSLNWSLDDAINAALLYSYGIDELRVATLENYQDIGIQFGKFDTVGFLRQEFRDSNTPVGNNFESDGLVGRIKEERFSFEHGIRRELLTGGQLEIGNGFGTRDNNSGVLNPRDQADATLSLRLSKELLKGAGRSIALNDVLIATQAAHSQKFNNTAEVADFLQQISDAYWEIFSSRAELVAAIGNAGTADGVLRDLLARKNIDADPNLVEQARVAVFQQQVIADQAYASLARAQFQLVRLVNAPELNRNVEGIEIIPSLFAYQNTAPPDVLSRQNTAIHRRPEIRQVLQDIKRAHLENHFAWNDLLPRLTVSAEAAFEGLSGNRDIPAAWRDRFDSDATYQLGFNFELPLQNREARFAKRKSELTLAKLDLRWRGAVAQVRKEVLDEVQNLQTNQSLVQRQQNVFASLKERLVYLEQRRYKIPKASAIPSLQLAQLLDVQAQLARSKADFATAIADRERSQFNLNRASGILVQDSSFGLENPGNYGCFVICRQYFEGKRGYRGYAKSVAKDVAAKSSKHVGVTWRKSLKKVAHQQDSLALPQHHIGSAPGSVRIAPRAIPVIQILSRVPRRVPSR